jgi:hydroxymethylglutaryl-CoA reductase (NADPH)
MATYDKKRESVAAIALSHQLHLAPGRAGGSPGAEDAAGLPRIPMRGHYTEEARQARLAFLHEQTGVFPVALQELSLSPTSLTKNVEALIGAVEVPVGMAGPLLFHGEHASGLLYAPIATTEGALVASIIRGAKAISLSGGVTTRVLEQRMPRVPVFVLESMAQATSFARWLLRHQAEIREQTTRVSAHADLVALEPLVLGRNVHVGFVYRTGDAAGQNMTTSCTWHACQWVRAAIEQMPDLHLEGFYIDGNVSGDKKLTYQSFLRGRGTRAMAECFVSERYLRHVCKVTPALLDRMLTLLRDGATAGGMVGYNVNTSNVIAGVFTATGQDIACVHEASASLLQWELRPDGIRLEMILPSLIVGTVGGGTQLPRQNELLRLMGCTGPGSSARLAEIIAGFCLALDLSTASALASGEFATAHEKLGRNRPVRCLRREEIGPLFFEPGLRRYMGEAGLTVDAVHLADQSELGSSIITEMSARKVDKLLGLFPYRLQYSGGPGGASGTLDVIVKIKPLDEEVMLMINALAARCGERAAAAYRRHRYHTGMAGCHVRELGIYAEEEPRLQRYLPGRVDVIRDDPREMYVLILERIRDAILLDSADDVSGWSWAHICAVIQGLAEIHSIWLGREQELLAKPWLGPVVDGGQVVAAGELWAALLSHAVDEFPDWFDEEDIRLHTRSIETIESWRPALDAQPQTLIHNDFNPRNIALRASGSLRLCAYDWELATLGAPQHDLAELLCFTLHADASLGQVDEAVELHRRRLEELSGRAIDATAWREGYRLSLQDLLVNRFGLYLMAHTLRDYRFLRRALTTLRHLIRLEERRAGGGM